MNLVELQMCLKCLLSPAFLGLLGRFCAPVWLWKTWGDLIVLAFFFVLLLPGLF